MEITFATYNILHGYHSDLILKNIKHLIEKGIDVMCLQETDYPFKNSLNDLLKDSGWLATYLHNTKGCNIAIIWNPLRLVLQNTDDILLPVVKRQSLLQRILRLNELQRGVISADFLVNNKMIRVTSTHLSWEGGKKQRAIQIQYLQEKLRTKKFDYEILAGDFNTFAPSLFRHFEERKVEGILSGWVNVFPNIPWTCDISHNAPQDGYDLFAKIVRLLKIKFRSRLDYVFTKNLKVVSKELLDLPGSDHRPLVAKFEI